MSSIFPRLAFAALLPGLLCACNRDTSPVDQTSTETTETPTAAPIVSSPSDETATIDPDGPDWARSQPWLAGAPCRAQAQMLYDQIAALLRGMSLDEQMQAYAERDDLGPDKAAVLPQIRVQLEKLYAAEQARLDALPPAVAAECLALQPPVGVDRERALACHLQHAHPVYRAVFSGGAPSTDQINTADHQFHRCLRGTI